MYLDLNILGVEIPWYWTLFLINWLVNIILIEFTLIQQLKYLKDNNEERDQKYSAFRRTDLQWVTRSWLYLACPFALIRLLYAFAQIFVCSVICKILVWNLNEDEPIVGIRYMLIRAVQWFTSRIVFLLSCSIVWISYPRPKVCYKKYLGDDWVANYNSDKVGTVITNHTSFLDALNNSMMQLPSHIAG